MKTTAALLLLFTGFALGALDVPPPTSGQDGWMRADVRAKLPSTVVLVGTPRRTSAGVAFEVLPGSSCRRAVAALRSAYQVRLNGRNLDGDSAAEACRAPRVHRVEVDA